MDLEALVSFIVPIYNVRKYIERCVWSIIEQSYRNIEIILVDDGSNDGSETIVDELAQKDDRVRVIHKGNEGVSIARNIGLADAKGEFILFIDGDDYIEPEYASYMVNLAIKFHCDMAVVKNCFSVNDLEQVKRERQYTEEPVKIAEDIYIGKLFMAVWNKLYRRSFLEKKHIAFRPDIWYGEGMLFNMQCLYCTDKVAVGERKIYHYVFNPNSAMRKFNLDNEHCGMRSLILQKQVWGNRFCKVEKAWEYHYRNCWFSIVKGLIKTNSIHEHEDEYKQCLVELKKDCLLPLHLNIPVKLKIVFMIISVFPEWWAKRLIGKEQVYYTQIESR